MAIFDPLNHCLGRVDFVNLVGRCRLHVNHNSRGNVDQIIRRIGVERRSPRGTPLRAPDQSARYSSACSSPTRTDQGRQILPHRTADRSLVRPVGLGARHTPLTVSIALHQAGVGGEPFSDRMPKQLPGGTLHRNRGFRSDRPIAMLNRQRRMSQRVVKARAISEPAMGYRRRQTCVDCSTEPEARCVLAGGRMHCCRRPRIVGGGSGF